MFICVAAMNSNSPLWLKYMLLFILTCIVAMGELNIDHAHACTVECSCAACLFLFLSDG